MGLNIDFIEVAGSALLFVLVFGMSATVDIGCMRAQIKNKRAITTALFLQFILLPFLGFVVVKTLNMDSAMGITLLVVTSSPGGSYSNWWCSMFNADLALSVTMTAMSTLLSIVMLPLNLLLYVKLSYDADVVALLDWASIFVSLGIVLSAITLGLLASARFNSHNFNLHANRLGNFAGISLVIFSAVLSNSDKDSQMWERSWKFYVGVSAPCILCLIFSNMITTACRLLKPERVTVSIESCYQNVGIATSVALSMFDGDELAEAIGVPFFYGMVEAIVVGVYCVIAWKVGWTKAPKNVSLWKAISTSYEIKAVEKVENEENVRHSVDDAESEGFHYVQQIDTIPDDALADDDGFEIAIRRECLETAEKKEPSYMGDSARDPMGFL